MKKKTLINILILLALSILTFYILFKKDFKDILLMLKNVDIKFILLGLQRFRKDSLPSIRYNFNMIQNRLTASVILMCRKR